MLRQLMACYILLLLPKEPNPPTTTARFWVLCWGQFRLKIWKLLSHKKYQIPINSKELQYIRNPLEKLNFCFPKTTIQIIRKQLYTKCQWTLGFNSMQNLHSSSHFYMNFED